MRVLVCGGRTYANAHKVDEVLSAIHHKTPITEIIHGGAGGADHLAWEWSAKNGITHLPFLAMWSMYGKAAGPIRNQRMLDEGKPDLVVAFPGGTGTAHMVSIAKKAGVTVIEVQDANHLHTD